MFKEGLQTQLCHYVYISILVILLIDKLYLSPFSATITVWFYHFIIKYLRVMQFWHCINTFNFIIIYWVLKYDSLIYFTSFYLYITHCNNKINFLHLCLLFGFCTRLCVQLWSIILWTVGDTQDLITLIMYQYHSTFLSYVSHNLMKWKLVKQNLRLWNVDPM